MARSAIKGQATGKIGAAGTGIKPKIEIAAMTAATLIAGRFRMPDPGTGLIGAGGMGTVYRGADTVEGRPVAIKVLREEMVAADQDIVRRFRREGEALQTLNHPNIVRVYAVVEEAGRYYLVMEYIPGGSLADRLARVGMLSVEPALAIAMDLADALTRAHRLGIIHRDLKPANILLAEDGPRLVDFGLAHLSGRSQLTRSGTVVGTVGYLSPEAIAGQKLDERADIWSLGVILYEMLAGQPPFKSSTPSETLAAILHRPAPLLSQVNPDVSDDLADLVLRMLEKERARRVPTARLVGVELERVLAGSDGGPAWLPGERFAGTPEPRLGQRPGHNLPADTTPFVGREGELDALDRLLAEEKTRLITIVGPGGMGKTRLALAGVRRQIAAYQDGVYFVPLAALESVEEIVPKIAGALAFPLQDQGNRTEQLLSFLKDKQILLLLDNFEHLLDGAPLLSEISGAAPGVQLLATSREKLGLPGEQLFPIKGLDHPSWETPEDAEAYASIQLFLSSARRVRPEFELRPEILPSLTRICRLAQGMPLAIELAAAWIDTLDPAEIAIEISSDLDFLETDRQGVPDRQRSIRVVFEHAWGRLAPAEQGVLRALSVFRGGFDRQAAQAATSASLRTLRRLVAHALLSREPGGRYQVHELMRQFAAEKLATDGNVEQSARDAHSDYFLSLLASQESRLFSPQQMRAMDAVETELENIRIAWRQAVARGKIEAISRAMKPYFHFLWWRERGQELAQDAAMVVERLETNHLPDDRLLVATALAWQGMRLPDKEDEALLMRALKLLDDLDQRKRETLWTRAFVFERLAAVRAHRGTSGIEVLYADSLQLFEAANDRWWQAECIRSLITLHRAQGALDQVENLVARLLEIQAELEDPLSESRAAMLMGWLARQDGRWEEAERLSRRVLALRMETGDILQEVDGYQDLGYELAMLGLFEEALADLRRAINGFRDLGIVFREHRSRVTYAYALLLDGDYQEAGEAIQAAARFYREREATVSYASAIYVLALSLVARGSLEEARDYLEESGRHFDEVEARVAEAICRAVLSLVRALLGEQQAAWKQLLVSLEVASAQKSTEVLGFALPAAALYTLEDGRIERAVALYAAACQIPLVANSAWFEDVIGRRIAEKEGEAPTEVVKRARAQGRSADLWGIAAELVSDLQSPLEESTSGP